jgi:hypothetical protein
LVDAAEQPCQQGLLHNQMRAISTFNKEQQRTEAAGQLPTNRAAMLCF